MYFDVPDLLNPSPQFSLGSIIYPLNAGFSEALDFTKIIWNYLLSALHDCKTSSATQSCLLLFFAQSVVLLKLFFTSGNTAWRTAKVLLASVHSTVLLIFKESTPIALHALITTKTKDR